MILTVQPIISGKSVMITPYVNHVIEFRKRTTVTDKSIMLISLVFNAVLRFLTAEIDVKVPNIAAIDPTQETGNRY